MNKNETPTDLYTGFTDIMTVFLNKFDLLLKLKPHEKPIKKTICIAWDHQM